MLNRRRFLALAATGAGAAPRDKLDAPAQRYVKLVLAVGLHDPDYVDAYYGPGAWKEEAARAKMPLAAIGREASAVVERLAAVAPSPGDELEGLRHRYLLVQTRSLAKRVEMLQGRRFGFDGESRALYDAVAPAYPPAHFQEPLAVLERLIPGPGTLAGRYEAWQKRFFIPAEKLDAVFRPAVDEARRRTRARIALPAGENFRVEYVKRQVWGAYNWYEGKARSLIQINTDLPVEVGSAVHLACHEGYPGHHVYNALLEDRLVVRRGWIEFTVYPLFSPQSLVAEGSAEYGVDLAFPRQDRVAFHREVLFPRAGLDPAGAEEYERVKDAVAALKHADNQAARGYLDGKMSRDQCREYLVRYALLPPERAAQRVRFIEKNRAYVINYNLGQDLIRGYLEKRGAPLSRPEKAWPEFERLLSSPRLPSGLV